MEPDVKTEPSEPEPGLKQNRFQFQPVQNLREAEGGGGRPCRRGAPSRPLGLDPLPQPLSSFELVGTRHGSVFIGVSGEREIVAAKAGNYPEEHFGNYQCNTYYLETIQKKISART